MDGDSHRMTEPAVGAVGVLALEHLDHLAHVAVGTDPARVNVGEIQPAVGALLLVGESYGTPKGFDVPQHFGAQRPDAGHPVAIEAPDHVVPDEALELV